MFKSAATKIAHNTTIPSLAGNKDLKPLQDLITAEKTVLISLQKLSVDFARAAEALRTWGLGEGDDLGDTLSASTAMLTHFSSALSQYATHEHAIRDHLKNMRTREEALDEMKRKRKSLAAKADSAEKKLTKMSPEHKNVVAQTDILNKLHEDIRLMDSEIMNEEAALGDFKRSTAQTLMSLKFGGLLECSEKGTIAGEFGLLVIAEIPQETTQPGLSRGLYHGHSKVESLMTEAHRCVGEVKFSPVLPSEPRRSNRPSTDPSDPNHPGMMGGNLLPPIAGGWSLDAHSPASVSQPGEPHFQFPPPDIGAPYAGGAPGTPTVGPAGPHSYPQPQSDDATRSVDDFGVNLSSGPIDPATGGGGRFATFPVKGRNAGAPSLNNRQEPGQSFSSSVAEALGSPNPAAGGSSFEHSAAPPLNSPMYAPPAGPPGAAAGVRNPWTEEGQGRGDRKMSLESEDDAQLAYMTNPVEYGGKEHGPKHVRFGEVHDDVADFGPHTPGYNAPPPNWGGGPDAGSIGSEPLLTRGNGSYMDPKEEERMLNAAAAREVSRELDSLTFNPPSPINLTRPSFSDQPDRRPSIDKDGPPPARNVSPFSRSSPRPSMDSTPLPYPGPPQGTPNQGQQAPYTPTQNPPPYTQPPGRLSPNKDHQDPRSISPMANNPPYRGPSEYGLGAPPSNRPSPANAPSALGARTISAAAFKRPPARSGDGSTAEVTPLSVKKRLPSSPYPHSAAKELPPSRGMERGDPALGVGGEDDTFDYISAYVNTPPGGPVSPQEADYGSLGRVRVANGEGGGGGGSHGYGEGRFATDLEGSLR